MLSCIQVLITTVSNLSLNIYFTIYIIVDFAGQVE